jgi:cytochrome c oxidase subunit 2
LLLLAIAAVVFVLVEGALVYMIFRYRKRSDVLPAQTHGNNLLEIIWTSIPLIITLTLFVFSFIVLVDVEHDSKAEDLTVDVQGFQFQWAFTYNQNDLGPGSDPNAKGTFTITGTAANEPTVVIPVDEPVEFRLKSTDVIHSFYMRDFLYKLDVIPGRDNKFTVTAKEIGTLDGQCAELCGLNHALMRFHMQVVSRADFDKYIADQLANANKAAQRP